MPLSALSTDSKINSIRSENKSWLPFLSNSTIVSYFGKFFVVYLTTVLSTAVNLNTLYSDVVENIDEHRKT